MKLVFIDNNRPITDSLTVAEAFEKEHRRVLQDIRELGCSEEFRLHHFVQSSYKNEQNRDMPKYLISEQGFTLLVMGYTGHRAMEFKEKYIAEFDWMRQELISKPKLPQNYKEALIALVSEVERSELLEAELHEKEQKLQLQAPKVALYDIALSADGAQPMGTVAKTLNIGRNKLFSLLREKKILMENNLPYQEYMERGYFQVRQYSITHMPNGIVNKPQTLVTAKGMDYILKIL